MSSMLVVLLTCAMFECAHGAATQTRIIRQQERDHRGTITEQERNEYPAIYQVYSLGVFESLLRMVSRCGYQPHAPDWLQFVAESDDAANCSVQVLCTNFSRKFNCRGGRLRRINLDKEGLEGHFPLSMVPDSVTELNLARNHLVGIGKWGDLRGKSLRSLDVTRNYNITLNLEGFIGNQGYLPLERLTVSKGQIREYFGLKGVIGLDPSWQSIREWVMQSSLEWIKVVMHQSNKAKRPNSNVKYFRDGTIASNIPGVSRP